MVESSANADASGEAQPVIDYVQQHFYAEYLEGLKEFVRIPSLSPLFDPEWQTNRNLFRQMDHLVQFSQAQNVDGMQIKPKEEPGRSPFLIIDVAAKAGSTSVSQDKTVLMYGHMDKQPFGEGWDSDPCDPVIKDGLLFGRGSNDDGYSLFTAILAIKACQDLGRGHPRVVITIEGSEEGEIDDLLFYMQKYKSELGSPDLVICLDAIANNTQSLFVTSTLRGILGFDIKVTTGKSNMHSGFSGAFPQPYPIMNRLLQRIMDFETQQVLPEFQPEIPAHCIEQTHAVARLFPEREGVAILDNVSNLTRQYAGHADAKEKLEMNLGQWWRPALTIIGIEGLPSDLNTAGNVVYKELKYRMSMRTPPNCDTKALGEKIKKAIMEAPEDITYGATVEFETLYADSGFCAPDLPPNMKSVVNQSTKEVFDGSDPIFVGCGGAIPFMEIFSQKFPNANFLLTGAATISGNAHCANENLDLEYCRKFITTIALVLSRM